MVGKIGFQICLEVDPSKPADACTIPRCRTITLRPKDRVGVIIQTIHLSKCEQLSPSPAAAHEHKLPLHRGGGRCSVLSPPPCFVFSFFLSYCALAFYCHCVTDRNGTWCQIFFDEDQGSFLPTTCP